MNESPRFGIDIDKEADKLGSYELANERFGVTTDSDEDMPSQPASARVAKSGKRVNRRGGRSDPEPRDSELDPHWNGKDARPLTDAERASNKAGAAMARRLLAEARPVEETPQQKVERQAVEVAEIRRNTAESWASYDTI